MAIDSIQYATVFVNDLDTAKEWYAESLGLEVRGDWPYGDGNRFLTVGPTGSAGSAINLRLPSDEGAPGGFTGIIFGSTTLGATTTELEGRGVSFVMRPTMQEWGSSMALFADPDGNVFVLHDQ